MTFFTTLLYVCLLVIAIRVIWFIIRVFWNAYKLRRFMRDPFAEAQRRAQQEYKRQQDRYGYAPQPEPRRKKKKIDPSVGEYIAFTEIEATQTTTAGDTTTYTTYHEQQITDIEWEDVTEN